MAYQITTALKKLKRLTKRIWGIAGGTSASKTISAIQVLIDLAQRDKTPKLTSITSESMPHLKRGAMRDFLNIMTEHGYFKPDSWNKSDYTYTFETNSKIEFFSLDMPHKVRGPRRDRLFINEANNIPYETFDQLEVRTNDLIILDWNPVSEFWFYTDIKDKRDDVDFIKLTYRDNEGLSKNIVESIERRKDNKNWWKVYGEGELGEAEGKIYKDWQTIDEIPHEARLERYGLDFGYTNDPSTLVAVYRYNGGYIVDQIAFQKGLSNKQIADIILNQPKALVVADSAEPKSIDEIMSYGVSIIPSSKGPGSVLQGIQFVQDQRVSLTKRSVDVIKEYRNYLWMTDRNGQIINEPDHAWSHCFAPETLVYTTKGERRIDELVGSEGYLYTIGGRIERYYDVRPTRKNAEMVSLDFDDGNTLTVTLDHLLLLPSGEWIEAQLLSPSDMIQSDTHEKGVCLQWKKVLSIRWEQVLQGICRWREAVSSSLCLGNGMWANSKGLSCSPQERGHGGQHDCQFRAKTQVGSSKRTHDRRTQAMAERMDKGNITYGKSVAWIKRGNRMAQVTWKENMGGKKTSYQKLCTLPYSIYNLAISGLSKILSPELQNESTPKKIIRITRRFCKQTYNLEVENTHCLSANGVIAHNSMDAVRYAIASTKPQEVEYKTYNPEEWRLD